MLDLWRLLQAAALSVVPKLAVSMPLALELEETPFICDPTKANIISASAVSAEDGQPTSAHVDAGDISAKYTSADRGKRQD